MKMVKNNFIVDDGTSIQAELANMTGQRTVPNVFINQNHIGGFDMISSLDSKGELVKLIGSKKASNKNEL